MISQRFDQQTRPGTVSEVHHHYHFPPQFSEALMRLVATFSQGTLFPNSSTTCSPESDRDSSPVPSEAQSVSPPPPVSSELPVESTIPKTMEGLLLNAPIQLQRKRLRASEKQQSKHRTSARAFDLWVQRLHRSGEPVQSLTEWLKTDSETLEPTIRRDFSAYWLQQGRSLVTVKNYWLHVVMICRSHGVHLQQWADFEIRLLADELNGEKQQQPSGKRKLPTQEEVDQICRMATVATTPYGEHSPYLWRGLVRWCAMFGTRTRDVISVERDKTGIRKQDIVWSEDCPCLDTNTALGQTLKIPGGCWVWIRIGKARKSKESMTLLPVPPYLRQWLKFFSELSEHPVRVFPSPQPTSASLSQATLSESWNAMLKAAAVDPTIRLSEGNSKAIALRKYGPNWWRLNVPADGLADRVAKYLLHHAEITRSTADSHYLSVRAQVLPAIIENMPLFPKPAADALPVSLLPE